MDSHRPSIASAREALVAELLEEIDRLVARLEAVDQHVGQQIGQQIEQATRDAAGKAFMVARLNFESLIEAQSHKLMEAAQRAARDMGGQLGTHALQAAASAQAAERQGRHLLVVLAIAALCAGAAGGAACGFVLLHLA